MCAIRNVTDFLTKCRDSAVLPVCVLIKQRRDIAHSRQILTNASVRLLKQLIRNCHSVLNSVVSELCTLHQECSSVLSLDDFDKCDRITSMQASRTYELCSTKHDRKFNNLVNRHQRLEQRSRIPSNELTNTNSNVDTERTVINLSNEILDGPTKRVLAKGMNFALTPISIPYEQVICTVEETIIRNKVPTADADILRQDVAVILRKSKLPKSNITTEERLALKQLRSNPNILVLKADKGNATVVMNSEEYVSKVRTLLADTNVYKPVPYNPTARVTRHIRAMINEHQDVFTEDDYNRLYRPKPVQPPKLYGLPKIHKSNIPLRPIVSQINSPTYNLAKHVAGVLQPLVGNTPSFVKDSVHFRDIVKSIRLEPGDIMVSFDVESLFTNVPLKDCLEVIKGKLSDQELPKDYIVFIERCLDGNYLLFRDQYYLQIDGVAMGSPLAPVIANIWMEHFEDRALSTGPSTVKLWRRYVDDIFCVINGGQQEVEQYIEHLNSIHPKMRFTYELEKDRSLAFLDLKIMAKVDGTLAHTVYRKPTHTDRYLHASSHHHPRHLLSVISSLTNRAHNLCDPEHLQTELSHIQEVLRRNGYKASRRLSRNRVRGGCQEVSRQAAFLPFVKGVTDKIGSVLRKYSIKTVYTPLHKVSQSLRSPKDYIPFQTPGVYKIDCSCGSSYIGQTKRTIAERVKEHIAAVKNQQTSKSAVAEHLLDTGINHWMELHNPRILSTDRHYHTRLIREAIEIKKYKNFNRENGFQLSSTWNPVIRKCKPRTLAL